MPDSKIYGPLKQGIFVLGRSGTRILISSKNLLIKLNSFTHTKKKLWTNVSLCGDTRTVYLFQKTQEQLHCTDFFGGTNLTPDKPWVQPQKKKKDKPWVLAQTFLG